MKPTGDIDYSLAELAEQARIAPRTIRYYISRGLLDGPVTAGRGAAYTTAHLERLRGIAELQRRGRTLAEIGAGEETALPRAVSWTSYAVADDVSVLVRADSAPWRLNRVREAIRRLAAELGKDGGGGGN